MPHTHRKKHPPPQKRLQVTDDAGWTHVTTGGPRARRVLRTTNADQILPAEAPAALTLPGLQTQFTAHQGRWAASTTAGVVRDTLRRVLGNSSSSSSGSAPLNIVCIGLGSPSGFLRGGWVDRRSVSMYQLAALVTIIDECRASHPSISTATPVYAQDPVFNALDESLLDSLGVTVVQHPRAFDEVSSRTLLFCPGAERAHLEQLLRADDRIPAVLFGGPLEDTESEVIGRFARMRQSVRLPRFEEQEHAFWEMRVYYPAETSEET
ncbi:hypothetical protein ATEIFO6365_0008033700 [Aspergillus terreus]|uniref:SRR1-like domain-containing protein n=1 Tax=Aspergillus terreus TaxID=33178 RepID=A0A5M3Z6D1_ASPTE|nr:hypothetical protein ATETN484_0010034600 [Aspergillus terreus]GFF18393.1 hypothetical protein ATEIFO6365_0008033700 [Aspergillus terreus]